MIKQHFSIDINAPVQRVRYTMLDDAGCRKRTSGLISKIRVLYSNNAHGKSRNRN